ncbi:glutathione peroxidase [Tissierella creatinini]|nr:glutathione peroxidase [Tissierella creatinini]TJX63967.1 glutathione peroxidase [Soehngenia saccharolytica]
MSIYEYSVKNALDEEVSLKEFEGKVLMIVNTATGCGFTPQYKDIVNMYEAYHDKGFEVLDIPCNQFAGQTPGTDEEIRAFCELNFSTEFLQMKKSDVNGENALPLYKYLKEQKGFEGFGNGPKGLAMSAMLKKIDKDYKNNPDIKWNFTKFIVDRSGNVVARFEPTENMKKVEELVKELL